MYDEETKTFSFPYDQKRIDAGCFIAESEAKFHNIIIDIRNIYYAANASKLDSHYRKNYRAYRYVAYWDTILDSSKGKIAQIACLLLNQANLVAKETTDGD